MRLASFIFVSILAGFLSSNLDAHDELRRKFCQEQEHFPQGDISNVQYIQTVLSMMYDLDQEIRAAYIENLQRMGSEDKDVELEQLMVQVAQFHLRIMKDILAVHGWITISKFGEQADHQAWVLIQYDDGDPFFYIGCLFLLSDLVEKGETNRVNYAYFYDRISLKFMSIGMRQKYGTQFMFNEDQQVVLVPYDGTLEDITQRREQMGITQIVEEYFALISSIYNKVDQA